MNVGVVEAEHGDSRAHHIHWERVLGRGLQEIHNRVRQTPQRPKRVRAGCQLLTIRQPIIPKQENNFLIAHPPGELIDVVAGVNELAFVANDVAQPRAICDDAFESA